MNTHQSPSDDLVVSPSCRYHWQPLSPVTWHLAACHVSRARTLTVETRSAPDFVRIVPSYLICLAPRAAHSDAQSTVVREGLRPFRFNLFHLVSSALVCSCHSTVVSTFPGVYEILAGSSKLTEVLSGKTSLLPRGTGLSLLKQSGQRDRRRVGMRSCEQRAMTCHWKPLERQVG